MLQFFSKNNTFIGSIESHGFEQFRYGDVNTLTIEWDPEKYLWSICWLYMGGKLVGSGIVWGYIHRKNKNTATLTLYPLVADMRTSFEWGSAHNNDVANVIESIINQYRSSTHSPLLYLKEKNMTGITFRHTFENQTLLEAWQFVLNKIMGQWASVIVEADGGVVIRNTSTIHNLTYKNDVLNIQYSKDISQMVNSIHFVSSGGIDLVVEDTNSINKYGKKVQYISDDRFSHIASVQEYCDTIFEQKAKPIIKVQSLETEKSDIIIHDRVTISNWEKNFDDNLFVNSITYKKNGMYSIDIGTVESRSEMMGIG